MPFRGPSLPKRVQAGHSPDNQHDGKLTFRSIFDIRECLQKGRAQESQGFHSWAILMPCSLFDWICCKQFFRKWPAAELKDFYQK